MIFLHFLINVITTIYIHSFICAGLAVLGCTSSPCIHGGNCTDNSTVPGLYSCTCTSGYTGLHCEVTDKCVKSENGKLCKNGACFYSADGLVRFCGCFNGEFWDEETMKCRGKCCNLYRSLYYFDHFYVFAYSWGFLEKVLA